jgi:hypothetical protein
MLYPNERGFQPAKFFLMWSILAAFPASVQILQELLQIYSIRFAICFNNKIVRFISLFSDAIIQIKFAPRSARGFVHGRGFDLHGVFQFLSVEESNRTYTDGHAQNSRVDLLRGGTG